MTSMQDDYIMGLVQRDDGIIMSNQNINQQPLSETLKHPIATATATIDRHRDGTSTRGATNTSTTFGINYHGTPQQYNPAEYNPNFQGNNSSAQQGGAMMRDDYNQQQQQQHHQGGGQLVGQQGISGQPQQQQQYGGGGGGGGGYSDGQQHQGYGGDQRQPMNAGGQAYNDQRQPMNVGGGGGGGGQGYGGQQQRFNEPSGGYGGQDYNRSNEQGGHSHHHQQDLQRPGYDAQRGYDNQETRTGSGMGGPGRAGYASGQTGSQGLGSTGAAMAQHGNKHQQHHSDTVDQNQMGRSYDNGFENQKYVTTDPSANQFTRQGAAGSGTGASSDTSSGAGSHRVPVGTTTAGSTTHHNPSSTGMSSTSPTNASKPGFGEKLRGATKEFMGKIDGDKERVVEGQQLQHGTHPTQQARR